MHPPAPEPGDSLSNSASPANSAESSREGFDSHSSSLASSEVDGRPRSRFLVNLTAQFLLISLLLNASIAFSIGMISRTFLLLNIGLHPTNPHLISATSLTRKDDKAISTERNIHFPNIRAFKEGKEVPLTTFTTKMFPETASTASNTVHLDRRVLSNGKTDKVVHGEGSTTRFNDAIIHSSTLEDKKQHVKEEQEYSEDEDGKHSNESDAVYLPSGNHLLVDIKHVDSQFLNSQERVAQALVDLIQESEVTLLSYHCHSLSPMGVRCVGILLSSHVSVHTWPKEGVIAVDLFTCDTKPLVEALPIVEKLFAIPSYDLLDGVDNKTYKPQMLWSHKLRGFRQGFSDYDPQENPLEADLGYDLLRRHTFDMKLPVLSDETDFQHVDIYEVINPQVNSMAAYQRSLSSDGSYESLHQDLYKPDKILFLDGVQQSTLYGEAAYHEALVHPSMIAHSNPKRVAIIGGGEGATLREVLKHKSVEKVVMIEIDEELVEMCEEHLQEMSSCTDIVGSDADSCFNDSRAEVVFEDAFKYFMDNFGEGDNTNETEKFDVIIMDALDPDKIVAIVGSLFKDNHFVSSLFNGLTEEGVFLVQMGEANQISDPANEVGPFKDAAHMMEALEHVGFKSMHNYHEGHSHFYAPWDYLVCLKDSKSRQRWYKNSAGLEIELHQRLYGTKSGNPPLLFFDAPTMASYQVPPKSDETVYCRIANTPQECKLEYHGINPKLFDLSSQIGVRNIFVADSVGMELLDKVYSPVTERHLRQILYTRASAR